MPWSGSTGSKTFSRLTGLFTGATAWAQTAAASRGIEAVDHDTHDQDLATGINTALAKDGGNKPTSDIDWGGYKITNLGTPGSGTDAATKTYVDNAVTSQTNATVRVASTTAITKATAMDNGKSMDGVTLATNDRVLLKDQASAAENGVWIVAASGAPARASDFDTFAEHVGSIINVTEGSANAGKSFRCTVNAGGTIDVTDITYTQYGTAIATPVSVANGGTGSATAADAFAAIKQQATTTATGVVEIATAAEHRTGTDTARVPAISTLWDAEAEVTISFSSTITPDLSTGLNFGTTVTSDFTLANPTNPKVGQTGVIRFIQDGTGGWGITSFGSAYVGAPSLDETAAAVTYVHYRVLTATKIELWINATSSSAGAITTIASGSLSGGSVTITGIPATYAQLILYLNGAQPNSNVQTVEVNASTNNGSSYDTTSSNYPGIWISNTTVSTNSLATFAPSNTLGASGGDISGTIVIDGYQSGPHAVINGQYTANSATVICQLRYRSTSAINALRLRPSSGNWAGGTYALYGVS